MLFLKTYQTAMGLSEPVLNMLLDKRLKEGKEIPERIQEKKGVPSILRPHGNVIWIHGASVGETMAALRLIDIILERNPKHHVLITSGTITSAALMEKKLPERAFHQFMPLDHPKWINRFLDYWRPDMALWLESELWPNFLKTIYEREIPLILVNGRVSPSSLKNWRKLPKTSKAILSYFNLILSQRNEDTAAFQTMGANRIIQTGNLKYSSTPLSFDKEELKTFQKQIGKRPYWLFASSHDGEEQMVLKAHKRLQKKYPNLLTVLVPRHPERGSDIRATLHNNRQYVAMRSKEEPIDEKTDFYLADTLGEMGLFYALCDIACIGGSFVPAGCHNPIEPAQLNCAILFGPEIFNFTETCHDLLERDAAIQIKDLNDLVEKLSNLLDNKKLVGSLSKNAKTFADQKSDIIIDVVAELEPYLVEIENRTESLS